MLRHPSAAYLGAVAVVAVLHLWVLAVTLDAAKQMELLSVPIVRAIFKGRELILRATPAADQPPRPILEETRALGAELTLVDGLITDAAKVIAAGCAQHGWFDLSTLKEPYRIEGKKTMGLELAEQLPEPITSLSLRTWPAEFPDDLSVLRRAPWEARADAVMYRQVLALPTPDATLTLATGLILVLRKRREPCPMSATP